MQGLELLHEVSFSQIVTELKKEAYMRVHPCSKRNGQYNNHSLQEGGFSEGQELIKKYIALGNPSMLARFGATELNSFSIWMQVNNKLLDSFSYSTKKYIQNECVPNWFDLRALHGMEFNSGFFPATQNNLQKWGEIVESDIQEVDLLFTWQEKEKYITEYLNGVPRVFYGEMYYPYRYINPWSAALAGKKVLVISPFTDTIESQYRNRREKIFPGTEVLPEFELKTIRSYNTIGGNNPYSDINSWFDALENMKNEMNQTDYDVVLLGCGSYAFDLAAHAKRSGKIAITLCGSLQVLFGIYGVRYEKYLKDNGLLNEFWVRPSNSERPEGYNLVEKGAYW